MHHKMTLYKRNVFPLENLINIEKLCLQGNPASLFIIDKTETPRGQVT